MKYPKHWDWYIKTAQVGLFYPLENICIISDRPKAIRLTNGLLHTDGQMAVEYTDGWGTYCLNGVRMEKDQVMIPPEALTIETILSTKNIDQRRELIKKAGISKVKSAGKLLEKVGEYELLDLQEALGDTSPNPFLWMKNPSLEDTFHLECVGRECTTVQQALNWRAGNIKIQWKPEELN